MRPSERQERILEIVTENGSVDVAQLSAELGVSQITVRRDLSNLEASGALRRVYRGATRMASGSYEPPFPVRSRRNVAAKGAIAAVVHELVDDGQTVVLDAGTTGVAIGERLIDRRVTICAPSLRIAQVLASSPFARVMMTGGIVRPGEQSLVGSAAVRTLQDHHFDLYIMTVSGTHAAHGFTEWNSEDAEVKRAALKSASRCIVACDSSKLGHTAFARVCDLDAVDMLVTDDGASADMLDAFRERGLDVRVAVLQRPAAADGAGQKRRGA